LKICMATIPCIPDNAPFTPEQRAWLNGFLAGLFSRGEGAPVDPAASAHNPVSALLLFGSQTGTAEALARKAAAEASRYGISARVLDMNAFTSVNLDQEKNLFLVTSTWGDGDPPDNAVPFWEYLNSEKAPALPNLAFSVLALGDRNYANFCAAGKKFDARLAALGAKRMLACVECDTDYEAPAKAWMTAIWTSLQGMAVGGAAETHATPSPSDSQTGSGGYSKANPFPARLLTNRRLNGPGSAKETRHFEISLGDSGLRYEVGDALGVMPTNCPALTDEILVALRCDGEEAVKRPGGMEGSFRKALLESFQITRIPPNLLAAFADRSQDASLKKLLEPANKAELDKFLYGREIIHLLHAYREVQFTPDEFLASLAKLQPRLYSISSSPKLHPGEVHLTVAVVRYESLGRACKGVCSTFLADRADGNTPVPVFVQTSHGFRLPKDGDVPIIMIGPGTGIAPFRAFLEDRKAVGAKGRNWLFFGDQCRATDFLYADELESSLRDGSLTRLDTAFSRDQAEKIYVQHRLQERGPEIWSWLEQGAHIYVCGDAKRMAKDVDAALHQLIQTSGGRTAERAVEYVHQLKQEKRYQRDVY
jgi:sulfite reductase (NADPH) flavoprotein alpha-component